MIRSYLVPHTMADSLLEGVAGRHSTYDNTTRTHERGLRPCLTRARSRLSHASCGMHTLARIHTQHSSQITDPLRATPDGSHSSLCARAAAATKCEIYPSRTTGKRIAAAARQLAPTCAANHRSPLIERFAMPARGARDQRTSCVGVVVGVHCIGLHQNDSIERWQPVVAAAGAAATDEPTPQSFFRHAPPWISDRQTIAEGLKKHQGRLRRRRFTKKGANHSDFLGPTQ